jgi:hypothetical protein
MFDSEDLRSENERLRRELAEVQRAYKNRGFVQVSKKHIDALNALAAHSASAHKTLWTLCKLMDKQNAVMLSAQALAKLCGYSLATVKRSVALLREKRWIDVAKAGNTNVYRVNSAIFWQARADGKWASFTAQVVLDWEEQDEQTRSSALAGPLKTVPFLESGEDVLVGDPAGLNEPPPDQPMIDFS